MQAAADTAYAAASARPQNLQAALLRCIFGNPFSPPPCAAGAGVSQHGRVVNSLARAAYENRQLPAGLLENARLVVLADALEEAGCEDRQILDHVRAGIMCAGALCSTPS
jgi:hypothetical protein